MNMMCYKNSYFGSKKSVDASINEKIYSLKTINERELNTFQIKI
jgi:hypothetical protein